MTFKKGVRYLVRILSGTKAVNLEEATGIWLQAEECFLVCASGLGDALMATPLVSRIKDVRPSMRIRVIASHYTAVVFERNSDIDEILTYKIGSWISLVRLLPKLRRRRHSVLLATQPSNTVSHSLIALASGAGLRLKHKYDYVGAPERDYSFVYHVLLPDVEDRHRVEKNLDLLRFLGEDIDEGYSKMSFIVGHEVRAKIAKELASFCPADLCPGIVAIHPGGLRPEKRWNPENFTQICQNLIKDGFRIALLGGRNDRDDSQQIILETGREKVRNFSDLLSLEESAALLGYCQFLISNDTGIMHLAVAVGTPVVAIFGPTSPGQIGPYDVNSYIVSKGFSMEDTKPYDVMEVVQQVLIKTGKHDPGGNRI
jgi:ADP-heptose:LPS heptosyltransferase